MFHHLPLNLLSVGELKNPSAAIPKGTIIAVLYTFIVYVLLFILASSTCERSEWMRLGVVETLSSF